MFVSAEDITVGYFPFESQTRRAAHARPRPKEPLWTSLWALCTRNRGERQAAPPEGGGCVAQGPQFSAATIANSLDTAAVFKVLSRPRTQGLDSVRRQRRRPRRRPESKAQNNTRSKILLEPRQHLKNILRVDHV